MKNTLDCKNEVAQKYNYDSWEHFENNCTGHMQMQSMYDEVAELLTSQFKDSTSPSELWGRQEWVSVEMQLPEVGIPVLCYNKDNMEVSYFTGKYEKPRLKKSPIWNDITGYYSPKGCPNEYTHWMPLPDFPESKELPQYKEKVLIDDLLRLEKIKIDLEELYKVIPTKNSYINYRIEIMIVRVENILTKYKKQRL